MHGARRIVIGTSGSPGNLQALRYAAGVARDCDATLVPRARLAAAGHGLRGWAFRHRLVPHGAVPAARRG